jgi:hypothetical protein
MNGRAIGLVFGWRVAMVKVARTIPVLKNAARKSKKKREENAEVNFIVCEQKVINTPTGKIRWYDTGNEDDTDTETFTDE